MKLKNLIRRIPRPLQAIVCTILVIGLAISYYIALGCPTFTFEQEFRRAEKVHMVGPSTIVDTLSHSEYSEFDGLIVGETENGICFFGKYYNSSSDYGNPFAKERYLLSYIRKTGELTIVAVPNVWGMFWGSTGFKTTLPVYLFTEESDAVRAEVEVIVSGSYSYRNENDETIQCDFTHSFREEATRSDNGFFRFTFSADQEAGLHALYQLSDDTGGGPYAITSQTSYPATVRLYNEAGNLISEQSIIVGNPFGGP